MPKREQYLRARQVHDAAALESYPWLADKAKGHGAAVQKAIEAMPALRRTPNHRLIAANAYVGEQLRRNGIVVDDALIARLAKEQKAKGGKPAGNGQAAPRQASTPPPRAPAAPGRAGTLPPRRTPAAAEIRQQEKKLTQSSGSVDDIAASIAAKMKPARR